jgi:hypothetical protein
LWRLDQQSENRGEDELAPADVLHDLDTADGRAALIGERLAVPPEREEASAAAVDESGETPSFNYDNPLRGRPLLTRPSAASP